MRAQRQNEGKVAVRILGEVSVIIWFSYRTSFRLALCVRTCHFCRDEISRVSSGGSGKKDRKEIMRVCMLDFGTAKNLTALTSVTTKPNSA